MKRMPTMRLDRQSLMLLALVLALVSARPTLAQNSETGGIGGTGVSQETGGIGGTGVTRHGMAVLGYGPIQAFGSVFLNGREYMFDSHTLVIVDGHPATVASLQVGDIARVEGVITGAKRGYAESIDIVHPVIGPVSAVGDGGHQAMVMGQIMDAPKVPIFAGLKLGDMVAVSAQLRANGSWAAGNVQPAPGAVAQILGPVTIHDGRLMVAGIPVILGPAVVLPTAGSQVVVIGMAEKDGLVAQSIVPGPSLAGPAGTRVEVSDYFQGSDGTVRSPDGLEVQNLPDGDKLSGLQPAEIDGNLEATNVIDLDPQQSDALDQTPVMSPPEPDDTTGVEQAPDDLPPELPSEPPENPDLDDK
ncbi:MAG: DUF5666 domain-containing protein [Acidocella sp.]|nr:DUF5666 domain-containing protein [Acidocella sp.]